MTLIFWCIAISLVSTATAVIIFKNPIYSALSLVANLFLVACTFALLEAHFLASVQIIVYAGAIMVLVLFMLMLLNIKVEDWTRKGVFVTIVGVFLGMCLVAVLVPLFSAEFEKSFPLSKVIHGSVETVGRRLYTGFVFTFEAASLLIMAAIVGAVMLAKKKYR